jgi:hypothetical protein
MSTLEKMTPHLNFIKTLCLVYTAGMGYVKKRQTDLRGPHPAYPFDCIAFITFSISPKGLVFDAA